MQKLSQKSFDRYLDLLGVTRARPDADTLEESVAAHLRRIPFENVSKIYRARVQGIRQIPTPEEFLDGIDHNNFGGTCYTNNYYLHLLLVRMGYRVRLCSADISVNGAPPDGHMVNVITIGGKEVIADVGYGAPFWRPIPRDSAVDVEIQLGPERYVIRPQDSEGRSRLELYRSGQLAHGYVMKPQEKQFNDFAMTIARSYGDKAPFLNRLVMVRFFEDWALVLRNHTLIEMHPSGSVRRQLKTRDDIAQIMVHRFGIPDSIAFTVLESLGDQVYTGA